MKIFDFLVAWTFSSFIIFEINQIWLMIVKLVVIKKLTVKLHLKIYLAAVYVIDVIFFIS